jgi:hypothetical protein
MLLSSVGAHPSGTPARSRILGQCDKPAGSGDGIWNPAGSCSGEVQPRTLPRVAAIVTGRWCEIMTDSLSEQLRDVVARPGTDVFAALQEFQLLPSADDQETRVLAAEDLAFDRGLRSARAHIDPQRPHEIVESTGGALYAKGCELNTWGSPPFMRLSRLPELDPFLILNFVGLAPKTRHTAVIDMQVVSTGGSVRISATNNPARSLVTHENTDGARVSVPVALTTTEGGAAVLVFRLDDQTEFDWLGADIF